MRTLALFVLLAASLTHAMYFHIAETEQKCLIEDVPEEIMVIGKYKVQLYDPIAQKYGEHPELGMYVVVRDPNGKIILSKLYTSEGRFTFTAHAPGEHTICLYSNSSSWFSHNELLVQLDLHTGELVNDYRDIAAKEKLTDLQLRARQLLDQADQIIKMQAYHRSREERFRETSENTSNRVTMWIIAQTVTLLLTGIWQMRNLKRFFEAKKLV